MFGLIVGPRLEHGELLVQVLVKGQQDGQRREDDVADERVDDARECCCQAARRQGNPRLVKC